MKIITDTAHHPQRQRLLSILLSLVLFWLILLLPIPEAFTQYFHRYNLLLFLIVLILYYFSFRSSDHYETMASLGLTMLLTGLCLSYIWSSGFSDNFIISGLIPYKDAKNYFAGAQLLLNGLPMVNAGQATERPLFPGFLVSLLWLTGQNLKISIAITTQLAALGIYFSSRQIRQSLGAPAASLFASLLFFYIQPTIGYTMSETLGFITGCFSFALVWSATRGRRWADLVPGVFLLLVAVSARAGAFFIFPLLALWVGWIFRGDGHFSTKAFSYAFIGILLGYFLVNSVYPRLLGIPPGSSFANFSYALYGQVRGGTGWHSAIEDLGTRDASVVYREAWNFFQKHPASLLIGFAKSYRDFFFGSGSMLPFGNFGLQNGLNSLVWITALVFLGIGLVLTLKNVGEPLLSLALAGFIGIFLSIPFLPPIDGGSRFYAATAPFFFVLPAFGISWFLRQRWPQEVLHEWPPSDVAAPRYISIALIVMTLIFSSLLLLFKEKPAIAPLSCPSGQDPFSIEFHSGSYVDLIRRGTVSCGFVPEICQDDFMRNNTEKSVDDFYQTLFDFMEQDESNARLIPAINLLDGKFHYFYTSVEQFAGVTESEVISGCAVEVLTKNQTIYKVQSLSLNKP